MLLNLSRPARGYYLNRRRYVLLLVIVLTILWFQPFLSSNICPTSQADIEPEFLWRSSYRDKPDTDYETQVRDALKYIEQVAVEHGDNEAAHKIWQILLGTGEDTDNRGPHSHNFQEKNAGWDFQVVSSKWANWFIEADLNVVPDLEYWWKSYPDEVLRADLLRYLVLWYHGGYYADLDVIPALPIRDCPSLQATAVQQDSKSRISLIIGIESDEPFATPEMGKQWQGARKYGFIQYTLYAPRRFSPVLREVIVRVLSHTKQHFDRQKWLFGEFYDHYDERTTHEITGPGVFTDTILDMLSETLLASHPLVVQSVEAESNYTDSPSKRVTWAPFHRIQEPVCIDASESAPGKQMGGLCVLPVTAWGNGQRHSGSVPFNSPNACVNHLFSGSWKKSWFARLVG